jgi:hypothetical protein
VQPSPKSATLSFVSLSSPLGLILFAERRVKEHLRTGNSIGLLDDMTSRLGQVGTHDRKNESRE